MKPMSGLADSANLRAHYDRKRVEESCLSSEIRTPVSSMKPGQSYRVLHLFLGDSKHPASTWTDFPTAKPSPMCGRV